MKTQALRIYAALAGALVVVFILGACATQGNASRWVAVEKSYNAALATMIQYREPCIATVAHPEWGPNHPACKIDDKAYRELEIARASVRAAIDTQDLQGAESALSAFEGYLTNIAQGG